jgi:CheY-like chemotaxis protein
VGQGSRFTVRIDAPLSAQAPMGADNENVAGGAEVKQVLCIDDNPRNLYVLVEILKAAGHMPTEVASGREALKLLGEKKFDVVLLDMVMPDMDGLDMLARLRAGGGINQETPVIACTANVLPDQVESYLSAGTAGVLAKPLNIREVLMAVAAAA